MIGAYREPAIVETDDQKIGRLRREYEALAISAQTTPEENARALARMREIVRVLGAMVRANLKAPVPNGVPIGLDELIVTRERWTREHLEQRPPWWRPLARLEWRAELEQLEVLPLGEVARRMRGA